ALVQHGVYQRGLSVVHVGDDGDIAKTLAQNNCPSCWGKPRAIRQTEDFGAWFQFTIKRENGTPGERSRDERVPNRDWIRFCSSVGVCGSRAANVSCSGRPRRPA